MIDFGARLSLKDNMYATLQKNLKLQRSFTEQVEKTSSSIKGLGSQRANPSITANDRASSIIGNIKNTLNSVGKVQIMPKVAVKDEASAKVEAINTKIRELGRKVASPIVRLKDRTADMAGAITRRLKEIATTYTPIVKLRDLASIGLAKIKNTIGWLGKAVASPAIKLKDLATTGINKVRVALNVAGKLVAQPIIRAKETATKVINKVKNGLKTVGKTVAKPFISLKDKASPVVNKLKNTLKTVGKTVAKPFVALKDGASKMLNSIKQGLKSVGSTVAKATVAIKDGATAGLSKIGGMLKSLAKGVTIAVGIAGAGVTALLGGSLKAGASMEQSIGGVETLYGADAGVVMANADKAYKTAGLSANEYMETVTSFSASLLQSVGGDTAKSAQIADMALIDMADNANKFGTDMGMIQNAYQGFAKQNYTMLDNLKLGYGGTQEEMERLLTEATKLSGVEYDIGNLADVYNAIHVIQDKGLGITGATKDEAEKTFTGSFNAMKASAKNLLANLALGGDITSSMGQLVDTASTFLFNNAIPMIGRVFESLPTAIGVAIEKGAPKLKQLGGKIVTSLKEGLKSVLPTEMAKLVDPAFSGIGSAITKAISSAKSVMRGLVPIITNVITTLAPVVGQIGAMFFEVAPIIADTLGSAFGESGGFIQGFADIVSGAIPVVKQVVLSLAQVFNTVIPAIQPILTTLGTMIQTLFPVIQNIIATFGNIVSQVFPIIANVISVALNAVMPIVQALANLIQTALPIVQNVISVVAGVIQSVMPTISQIFTEVGAKIAEVINTVVVPVMGTLQGIFEKVSPILQRAIETIVKVVGSAWDFISPIIDLAMVLFKALWAVLDPIISAIVDGLVWLWDTIEPIFGGIADGLSIVGDAIGAVGDFIGDGIDTIAGWFGFAYGKDRVPYDNYPAILHQGEKVLTRNQADQYERAVSTRGVQLNHALQPVDRKLPKDDNKGGIGSAGQPQEEKEISKAGTPVHIEKLADTIVIEKEADVDKVVEDMVKKFRKLVPNVP